MPISIYLNGTTGATNGTLEIPGDETGVTLGQVGATGIIHLRAPSGQSNTESFTVLTPTDCVVSTNGTSWDTTASYAIGAVGATNVPLYLRRTGDSFFGATGITLSPRAALIATA